ncbi:YebC/PmpR family DNA-binding transcriptional regulator [Litorivicinus lipolyticus]|uniref:Probable transcriptional regulatory protein GH975_05130 n=1 Tax=Litorivicinus lipolyticus TaxID=418701 RepID=A0A5Q2QAF1_9GAMM|nr:YebC/PmpR family DNA-binding transcriptional regulator [Litorivicinus lipolyticus]QGG79994.1 YebC/PmpR family DNA-binding transcriptional regulator [Litorivicinus lipolyticus]
MAGHSKWANIKHKKAKEDAKRGKVFTKLIRELVVAARMGGPEPNDNPRLRAAVDKALSANMTKDTLQRAIDRGAGNNEAENIEELTYEGYGVAGVAVMVDCMTDNRNRTASEVRHAFSKCGGNLGTDGSVNYLFAKKGQIFLGEGASEDAVMDVALEAGADDVVVSEQGIVVETDWTALGEVRDAMDSAGFEVVDAGINQIPSTVTELSVEDSEKVMKLIDMLEDLDDVQEVHTNAEFADEFLDSL